VGFGTPVPLLVGIVLIILGIGLFFLDNFKPGYKRDSDTVYAVLLLTVGILSLLIWNAGFAEALQLMVAAGTIIALMIERIQTRSANADVMRPAGGGRSSRREVDRPSRPYRGGYDDSPRSDLRVELDEGLLWMTLPGPGAFQGHGRNEPVLEIPILKLPILINWRMIPDPPDAPARLPIVLPVTTTRNPT
jgi:4-amino-4-deoxy-L-arabinose transferase-like glycosyltransferase